MKVTRKWWFWAIVVVVVAGIIGSIGEDRQETEKQTVSKKVEEAEPAKSGPKKGTDTDRFKITASEFGQIETGMTLREVADIIGMTGSLVSEAGEKGTEAHAAVYKWDGIGGIGANAIITFTGGKVTSKAQYGLE